jgi:hypothetical protein
MRGIMPKCCATGGIRQQAGSRALRNAPTDREGGIAGWDGAQRGMARVPSVPTGKQEGRAANRGDMARLGIAPGLQAVHHHGSQGFDGADGFFGSFGPKRHGQDFDINRAWRG